MIATGATLTEGLASWLRSRHDDGHEDLRIVELAPRILAITRADGSELSETERTHVRAVLAAHAVEPLSPRGQRRPTMTTETTETTEAADDARITVDVDSVQIYPPECSDDEDDAGSDDEHEQYCHYISVEVTVDGAPATVGVVVGARESDHGSVRASGAGVRPYCSAWWADPSDWEVVGDAREAVLDALVAESWTLYQRACGDA